MTNWKHLAHKYGIWIYLGWSCFDAIIGIPQLNNCPHFKIIFPGGHLRASEEARTNWMCWLPPVVSVLARLRQEDCWKFEDGLSYILSSSTACAAKWDCLKHQINKTQNPSTVCVVFAKCWSKKMYYLNRAEALTRLIDRPCFYLADVHCAQGTEAHGLRP